jgi:hypothetical protein
MIRHIKTKTTIFLSIVRVGGINVNKENYEMAKKEAFSRDKETAAALALGSNKRTGLVFPVFVRLFKLRVFMFVILLAFIVSISTFFYFKFFSGNTYKSETFSIVESVQELATLATAEAVVTTIVKEEDNKLFNQEISINLPGTKRTLLLIVPATVIAGVDLTSVTDENIKINEDRKEITLTIPRATLIQEPSIQMDKVQTYSEEGLFRSEVHWDEGYDLAAKATIEIKNEAIQMGLLTKAEESAEKVLSSFFSHLGYTAKIQFK